MAAWLAEASAGRLPACLLLPLPRRLPLGTGGYRGSAVAGEWHKMSADDLIQRLEQASQQKELGTEALKDGDTATAQQRYEDALKLLHGDSSKYDHHTLRLRWAAMLCLRSCSIGRWCRDGAGCSFVPGDKVGRNTPIAAAEETVLLVDGVGIDSPPPPGVGEQFRLLWAECARQGRQLELACNLNLALCCIKRKLWTRAIDAAGAAVQRDPKSAKAWFRRGMARAGNGQDEEAQADLLHAARLAPQDKSIRRELKAVKERRQASKQSEPSRSAAGTAAVAAAMVSSGALYDDVEKEQNVPPLQRVERSVARAHRLLLDGTPSSAGAALEACKQALRKIQQEENVSRYVTGDSAICFAPFLCCRSEIRLANCAVMPLCRCLHETQVSMNIARAQRFMVHVLAGACHVSNCHRASQQEAVAAAASRAVADLAKAERLLRDSEEAGAAEAAWTTRRQPRSRHRNEGQGPVRSVSLLHDLLLHGTAGDDDGDCDDKGEHQGQGALEGQAGEPKLSLREELEARLAEAQALAAQCVILTHTHIHTTHYTP